MSFIDRNIAMLGGAAAAVLAGAYIMWGPSERRKTNKGGLWPIPNHD